MQQLPDDEAEHARSPRRWRLAAFVVFVALTTAGASMLFLREFSFGPAAGALFVVASVAVARAWTTIGPSFAARLLALGQGTVWFFLLIHGGLGLVFGPAGWAASAIAGRAPSIAATILAIPAAFLAVSWAPVLIGGLEFREGLILVVLIPPALLAAGVFTRTLRHGDQESVT